MKANLIDETCELLKWLCNYRKLHYYYYCSR